MAVELIAFNASDLIDLDKLDGNEDGVIDLRGALEVGHPDVWNIQLGDLEDNLVALSSDCTGDRDGDGYTDAIFGLTTQRNQLSEARTDVIFLMQKDWAAMDGLDGKDDYHIDISRVWPQDD